MAAEINKKKPRSKTCFLGCFGVCRQVVSGKESGKAVKDSVSLLSWSKMKRAGSRTVPVDHATERSTADQSGKLNDRTPKPKWKLKWLLAYKFFNKRDKNPLINRKSFDEIAKVAKMGRGKDQATLESRKPVDQVADSAMEDTCQKRLPTTPPPPRGKTEGRIRRSSTGVSQPSSPKPSRTSKILSHSVSLPPPALNVDPPSRSLLKSKNSRQNNNTTARTLDPLLGMSVIVVILIIMLVWGRLCAVVCTCAWFYFVARLRNQSKNGDNKSSGDLDLNSEEYKKKVVLEGFLERDRRASAL